jgi:hypothetical protein
MMTAIFVLYCLAGAGAVVATLGLHSAACDMHVWAVDRAKMPHDRFYRCCKLVARLTNWI